MPWKTILVPHDFSSCANHAAALARDVARTHGARIVLIHVAQLPLGLDPDSIVTPEGGAPMPARQFAVLGATEHLEDLATRIRKEGIEVRAQIMIGDTVDEIVRAADRTDADVIVMGTHGRTGVKRIVIGSVAEKVVRLSPVPVLTLREPDAAP
jgi:nucleotide-binding universal stress UspA family protein